MRQHHLRRRRVMSGDLRPGAYVTDGLRLYEVAGIAESGLVAVVECASHRAQHRSLAHACRMWLVREAPDLPDHLPVAA
jgi:hypothetical protein